MEIPHYCYHPGLSIAGNCRMCLVEVEKAPKLLIACADPGAGRHGRADRAASGSSRPSAAVMEFLLINHPLDCPICDQAGECRLQEYAVEYGTGVSRFVEPKVALNKAVDIGRHVHARPGALHPLQPLHPLLRRGHRRPASWPSSSAASATIIGIYPGKRLDNPYSGNVVDICPVGALTLKEFRFQTRVWYLKNTPSICAGCARGCNVDGRRRARSRS